MSYDIQSLLINPVLKTKEFYSKNITEIEFLEDLSAFLMLKIEDIDKQKIRYGSIHFDVWFDNLHIDDEKEITFSALTFVATVIYILIFLIFCFKSQGVGILLKNN